MFKVIRNISVGFNKLSVENQPNNEESKEDSGPQVDVNPDEEGKDSIHSSTSSDSDSSSASPKEKHNTELLQETQVENESPNILDGISCDPQAMTSQSFCTSFSFLLKNNLLAIYTHFKQNEGDLLKTVEKTVGKMSIIDFSEIEMGPVIGEGGPLQLIFLLIRH